MSNTICSIVFCGQLSSRFHICLSSALLSVCLIAHFSLKFFPSALAPRCSGEFLNSIAVSVSSSANLLLSFVIKLLCVYLLFIKCLYLSTLWHIYIRDMCVCVHSLFAISSVFPSAQRCQSLKFCKARVLYKKAWVVSVCWCVRQWVN